MQEPDRSSQAERAGTHHNDTRMLCVSGLRDIDILVGDPVAVGVEDGFPAGDLAGRVGPVFSSFDRDEVEDFQRGLLGREMCPVACGFAEPGVQRLDRVYRVDEPAELNRKSILGDSGGSHFRVRTPRS